jgi:hypothetical protein
MEPTHPVSFAIMSLRRAAQRERWADGRSAEIEIKLKEEIA